MLAGTIEEFIQVVQQGDASKLKCLQLVYHLFKAYVQGYEVESIATRFVDVNKARDFDTQNNNKTRFTVDNFINVDNVYGTPDIGLYLVMWTAFKNINLYDTETVRERTQNQQLVQLCLKLVEQKVEVSICIRF